MATLFDCSADNIGLHLKNIYDAKELTEYATTEKISVVQQEGTQRGATQHFVLQSLMTIDTTNLCSHLQKKLFEPEGILSYLASHAE